jgi:hypothetical protein
MRIRPLVTVSGFASNHPHLACPPARPGFSPRELVLDDLKRLPYLSSALKEAMRMLPVVSIMGRWGGWVLRLQGAPPARRVFLVSQRDWG